MKKLSSFCAIFLFLISVFSCKRDCDYSDENCTDEELSWISYNGGEALIFKNNFGKRQLFLI